MTSAFNDILEDGKKEYSKLSDEEKEEIIDCAICGIDGKIFGVTVQDIADELSVTPLAISKVLEGENSLIHIRKTSYEFRGYRWGSVLRQLHIERTMSASEIADYFDVQYSTIIRWFDKTEVERRDNHSQSWKGHSGWDEVVTDIIERDERECRVCGMSCSEHQEQHNQRLHVHHVIEEDAFESSELAADPQNLVTICKECHREYEGRTPREMFMLAFCGD